MLNLPMIILCFRNLCISRILYNCNRRRSLLIGVTARAVRHFELPVAESRRVRVAAWAGHAIPHDSTATDKLKWRGGGEEEGPTPFPNSRKVISAFSEHRPPPERRTRTYSGAPSHGGCG